MEYDNFLLLGIISVLWSLVSGVTQWPAGNYALLRPQTGCPGPSEMWQTTSIYLNLTASMKDTDNVFSVGSETHLSFEYHTNYLRIDVCSKILDNFYTGYNGGRSTNWPAGRYCVLNAEESDDMEMAPIGDLEGSKNISRYTALPTAHGRRCPDGFQQGSSPWPFQLPSYGYVDDVTGSFSCCQDTGMYDGTITLPTRNPFYLLRRGSACQEVKGMSASTEFLEWLEQTTKSGEMSDLNPANVEGGKEYFCYYTPITPIPKELEVSYTIQLGASRNISVNKTSGVSQDLPPPPDFTKIKIAVGVVVLGTPSVTLLVLCICRARNIHVKRKMLRRDSYRMTSFTYQSSFTTRRYSNSSPPSSDAVDKPQKEYTYKFQNHRLGVRNSALRCEV